MPQPLFAFEVGKSQLKAFSGAVSALADVGRELELVVFTQDDGEPAVSLLAKDDGDTVFGTCIFERRFFSRVAVDATLTTTHTGLAGALHQLRARARRAGSLGRQECEGSAEPAAHAKGQKRERPREGHSWRQKVARLGRAANGAWGAAARHTARAVSTDA